MLMANKKGGLDGFQFKDLKQLPLQAFSGLAWMYERIEATGKWPQQILWVMVACLPKSDVAERPIGLLATCYRLWAKMRKFLLTRWQQSVGVKADWDKAVLGGSVFEVACMRQLKAEAAVSAQLNMCTFLSDLRHFSDSVDLESLAGKALELDFPPLLLHHLLCVHSSPRVLVADEQCSRQILPRRGIVAGCPMATSMAKIFLWDIVSQLVKRRLPSSVSTWVDDLGLDVVARKPREAAVRMTLCYREYSTALERNGLILAKDKSGFLVSNPALKKELAIELRKRVVDPPAVVDVIKDLGMDGTCGRLRRLPTQKKRASKARQKVFKLGLLERAARQRLFRTNAFPSLVWGHQHLGMAPSRVKQLRTIAAKASGVYVGIGQTHMAMRMAWAQHQDP